MMTNDEKIKTAVAPAPFAERPPLAFETERLKLRAMEAGDVELVFRTYSGDAAVTKYLSFPCASNSDDSRLYVQGVADNFAGRSSIHPIYSWLVFRKDSGACIGCAGLVIKDQHTLSGGYVFSQSSWGQGFATEAWRPIIEWGKTQPDVNRIEAEHHADIPASGKVMLKLGLSFERVVQGACVLPNIGPERVDMLMYAWKRHAP